MVNGCKDPVQNMWNSLKTCFVKTWRSLKFTLTHWQFINGCSMEDLKLESHWRNNFWRVQWRSVCYRLITNEGWSVQQWRKIAFSGEVQWLFEMQWQWCQFVCRADGDFLTPKHFIWTFRHHEKVFWDWFTYSGPRSLHQATGILNNTRNIQILRSNSFMKDKDISILARRRIMESMVFPMVPCGSKSWTVIKENKRRIDAFKQWCWVKILKISWTAKRTNNQ